MSLRTLVVAATMVAAALLAVAALAPTVTVTVTLAQANCPARPGQACNPGTCDCASGFFCINKRCQQCRTDSDCLGDPYTCKASIANPCAANCIQGKCTWVTCPNIPTKVGDACSPQQCGCPRQSEQGVLFCQNGVCAQCTAKFKSNCKPGQQCRNFQCYTPVKPTCAPGVTKRCDASCTCAAGFMCNPKSGVCVPKLPKCSNTATKVLYPCSSSNCPCPQGTFCDGRLQQCVQCNASRRCPGGGTCFAYRCFGGSSGRRRRLLPSSASSP